MLSFIFISFTADYNLTIILKLHFLSVISGSEEETEVIMAAVLRTIITMEVREDNTTTTTHLDTDTSYLTFTFPPSRKEIKFSFCHFYFHILPSSGVAGQSRCEGSQVFVKEADVVMRGAREMARLAAASLSQCTDKCR